MLALAFAAILAVSVSGQFILSAHAEDAVAKTQGQEIKEANMRKLKVDNRVVQLEKGTV